MRDELREAEGWERRAALSPEVRRIRVTSNGEGRNTEIVVIEPDGTEKPVPYLRRLNWSIAFDGVAEATLEAICVELRGQGTLVAEQLHIRTEADVVQLLEAYGRAVSNLHQAATMLPAYAQEFARSQYAEHVPELRRWLVDFPATAEERG